MIPTRAATSATRAPTIGGATPRSSRARPISSATRVVANASRGFCSTTPTARAVSRGGTADRSSPTTCTPPESEPPSTWECSPLRVRSSVDFPEPVGPDTTTSVPGSRPSSSMRSTGASPNPTVAPRRETGSAHAPSRPRPPYPRSSRAAATAVARSRVRSRTGERMRAPWRSPRSCRAKRTARTASASAGRVAHATDSIRAMPRNGPRRAPRARSRGRSSAALSTPKTRIVAAIGTALIAAAHRPSVVAGPSATTCANGGGRRRLGRSSRTVPFPSAPWNSTR